MLKNDQDADVYEVIEGNRRLAACKMINEKGISQHAKDTNKNFSILQCEVAPEDLTEDFVFALLGILHLKGKIDWSPFAKASYVKRRFEKLGNDYEKVALEIQESPNEISKQIANINLMQEFDEENEDMYSFYNVLHRNRNSKQAMNESDFKKKKLVEEAQAWRRDGKQPTDFRDAIRDIFKDKQIVRKYFNENNNLTLSEAREEAIVRGSTDEIYNRIKTFRQMLNNEKRRLEKIDPKEPLYKKLKYEFDKLKPFVVQIHAKFEKGGKHV